jgi:hydrophobic/amphiphilic exporter-1 (mainly G- bacteria), HAE1 family
MNLSEPFIKRPVMTTLAMLALLVAGIISYMHLPISSMPNVTFPTINVKVTFPGALPDTMATSVALPLEKQMMAIPGLRLVSSNNILGSTSIVLQFEIEKDMLIAAQDVQEAITSALPYLPLHLPYGPTYRKVNPAEQPILYLSLTSKTMRRSDLYTYGNTLVGQRLSMLDGVSQVTTYGSILAIRVQVDPAKLAAKDVTLGDVAQMIALENTFLPSGQLDGPIDAPIISVDGQLVHGVDYEPLIVAYRNGTPVRISDLGQVQESFQNNKIYNEYIDKNGIQPSVTIAIQKEPYANTVAIADEIYRVLNELKGDLPPAIDLHILYDRSIPVRSAIEDATVTMLIALCLVVLVIFLFLGKIADTVIPSLVLPMSVIGTFLIMRLLGFTLDNLSVLALTLAMGFIIDDAVVVLENIVRLVESGKTPLEAALEGSREICFTIVSMSLSLIAVFIPMLFMGGLIGKIFHEFAVTLTIITILSGLISLTLTPMLASRFIPPKTSENSKRSKIALWSEKINHFMQKKYEKALIEVLDHRFTALFIAGFCLAATFWLLKDIPTDFLPDEDVGFFVIYTQTIEGGSSANLLRDENQLIEIVKKNPAVDRFVVISSVNEYRKGLNLVLLKPISQRPPIQTVIQEFYQSLRSIDGMQSFIKNIPLIDLAAGQESRAAYQFALQSIFQDKLYPSAKKLLDKLKNEPMFQSINSDLEIDTPQFNIEILRDKASTFGITSTDIENVFNFAYSGNLISLIQTAIDQYNVILELYPEYQRQIDTLNTIWLRSPLTSELVPLNAVANWKEALGATSVNHINQFPSVTVSFNLAPGVPLETALDKLEKICQEVLEPGVTAAPIGAAKTFQDSVKSAGILLLITIVTIYIILGMLYESFLHPLTILTTLPPATFGGLLVLLIFNIPLSLYSFLGLILLIGIVKKNGIMMVDFALENVRKRGMSIRDATINASLVRFRPIMMTTVAAIFGVLPIAFGYGANASARKPLGLVIIGGLFLSQLVTLFITPILYVEMERLSEKFGGKT